MCFPLHITFLIAVRLPARQLLPTSTVPPVGPGGIVENGDLGKYPDTCVVSMERHGNGGQNMKKSNIATVLIFLLVIPATLFLGSRMPGRWYYVTSTLIIAELLIPFFLALEGRKPQARELVLLAVMCALAVAARVAIPIPNFKAIYGIIMIAGIAFGPESGFLVGAVSALSSNFFLSQGPYTPWQMLAYGAGGMLTGFLFRKDGLPRSPFLMGIAGFLGVLLVVGPILDTCTVCMAPISMNWKNILAIYLSGFVVNISQSISTFAVLFFIGNPMLEKLKRIQIKYGMIEEQED